MSETPEEFRERIGRIAHEAWPLQLPPWDVYQQDYRNALADQAEAVYAQALRDIRSDFGGFYGGWEHGDEIDLRDELADFAAARGIDLTEG